MWRKASLLYGYWVTGGKHGESKLFPFCLRLKLEYITLQTLLLLARLSEDMVSTLTNKQNFVYYDAK